MNLKTFFEQWVVGSFFMALVWAFISGFWGVVIAMAIPSSPLITDKAGIAIVAVALGPFGAVMVLGLLCVGVGSILYVLEKLR